MRSRPLPVTVAAIVLALFSVLYDLSFPLWAEEELPVFSVYLIVVVGVVGLVAAAGLWMLRRWGFFLTVIVSMLNILVAAPWIAVESQATGKLLAGVTTVGFALVLVLVMQSSSRRALDATS